tara:strand:+ start:2652 stop:3764 length:1113 start_codon:yes stop_codon:yes gene_type:complete
MPAFKPKCDKKLKFNVTPVTLDDKHQNHLDKFYSNKTIIIPELKRKIKALQIDKLKHKKIETKMEIVDKIKQYKQQIRKLEKEEKKYLLDNSNLVFDYFEDKKNISNNSNAKNNKLNAFFKINEQTQENQQINTTNVNKYLANIDDKYIYFEKNKDNTCKLCNVGELIYSESDGLLICNECHNCQILLIDNDKPSFKEPPKEICFYAYKRINHFREILAQFQAKESTQIPDKVVEDLKSQIKKERIEIGSLTNVKTKEILKKLGYNKYYEHIPFIKDLIGIKPPNMSPELEETLCNLFTEIQEPYAKYCPDDRVNFLNYYYTIYKLCELLEQRQFLPYFPMLKDREKRIEQDEIWKKICYELSWEFIPTI